MALTATPQSNVLLKLLLFATLFYVVNQAHIPFETHIPAVAPSNLLVLLILLAMRGRPEQLQPTTPILKQAMYIFFGALTLSFLWAQVRQFGAPIDDVTYLKNAIFFPLFYFLYRGCRLDEKSTRQLIIWIMVIAAIGGFQGLRQGLDYGFGAYNPTHRASGPMGTDWRQSNRAGVYYAMFMPMFAALLLFLRGQKLWRLAALAGCVLVSAGTLFTYSRQAYFLIVLGLAVLLVRRSIILAVIISITLVSASGYLPDSVVQRVDETSQHDKHGKEEVDESTSSRWEIWAGAMGMLKDNPMGVGLNRFKANIGNYSTHKGYDAHNFYVLTLAECGPIGLGAWLFFVGVLFFKLSGFLRRHAPPEDPEMKALALGFTVSTLCMALGGIYGSPTLEGSVMAPYWALCGLLERYTLLKMQRAASTAAEQPVEPTLEERFPLSRVR